MSVQSRSVKIACVVFLASQILIPAIQLFKRRPARFGWQMYSSKPSKLRVEARFADRTERVDVGALVVYFRGEIDYASFLPALVCQKEPLAISVRMNDEEFTCVR
jgi:hypothetical protein